MLLHFSLLSHVIVQLVDHMGVLLTKCFLKLRRSLHYKQHLVVLTWI